MPKFKFERVTEQGIAIDKLSFCNSNIAQDIARDWLKNDLELNEVIIIQIEPKEPYRVIIDRYSKGLWKQ